MPEYSNHAAWLLAKHTPLTVAHAPVTQPGPNEVLVRTRALAINPFDGVVQTLGGMVTPWVAYPAILGSDVAGEVVCAGAQVSRFKPGDRVLGLALGIDKVANRAAEGAFQEYVILREQAVTLIPDGTDFEPAAVLPLAVATAACGLFLDDQLGLRWPVLASARHAAPNAANEAVVIWGGATSVGNCAIQLAVAAGYHVVTTASPKNFAHVRGLGAAAVFDYQDRHVVNQVVEALRGFELAGVLSIAAGSGAACVDIASRCAGRKRVAMASAPLPLNDAPLTQQLAWKLSRLPRLACGFLMLALRARLKGVKTCSIWGTALLDTSLCSAIFADFLGPALASGQFKATPQPLVAGHSLHDIAAAMAVLGKGVSGRKVVVSL
jgi:NADPH:quinone reductase-like Zn-dependent oxidoreductase